MRRSTCRSPTCRRPPCCSRRPGSPLPAPEPQYRGSAVATIVGEVHENVWTRRVAFVARRLRNGQDHNASGRAGLTDTFGRMPDIEFLLALAQDAGQRQGSLFEIILLP